jgi:hypothetical protein
MAGGGGRPTGTQPLLDTAERISRFDCDINGNGIELYWDRPESEWPRNAEGGIAMFTRPLDLDALLGETGPAV